MLFVAKGVAILVSDADPCFVPPATLLFALGMVGLHARLAGRGGLLGTPGVVLAWVAVGASAVNLTGLALPIPAPGEPGASVLLRITHMAAFLGILVGLLASGVAALRSGVMAAPRGAVPLAVGVLWFPLLGVGFPISGGVGLALGGLAWASLGYALWSESRTSASQPSPRVRCSLQKASSMLLDE